MRRAANNAKIGLTRDVYNALRAVPGHLMAAHCNLMVHRSGHGSVMTGLQAGTPVVIVPTITEQESNARRPVAFGGGEIVMPVTGPNGEKTIHTDEFRAAVLRMLKAPAYRYAAQRVSESMRYYGGSKADAGTREVRSGCLELVAHSNCKSY